ncbi:MAG: cupin domain-containing protein [Stappiaceae bacterium]
MKRTTAKHNVQIDDDRVRVTRWDFAPGEQTGWHRHEMDYVVTLLTDCHFMLEEPDGQVREVEMTAGESYRRSVGVSHNVINGGAAPMSFVEVELKD